MFETELQMDEKGITVPYPPLSDDLRKNHGFIDVRGQPELASQIAEAMQSSVMTRLLVALAQPDSKLFSVGCDLGSQLFIEEKLTYTAGGYVQVMDAAYSDRSPDGYSNSYLKRGCCIGRRRTRLS